MSARGNLMRFGNGFGSVYKLSGNRRNPWAARKTVGWKDNGQPEYFFVGYFRTRSEALNALVEYNTRPEKEMSNLTFYEVFEKWSDQKFPTLSASGVSSYRAAVKVLAPVYNLRFADIKLATYQECVDKSEKNTPTLKNVKNIIGMMYDFAVVNEIVPPEKREFMKYLDVSKAGNPRKIERSIFEPDEIEALWAASDDYAAKVALILIYSGLRIGELLELESASVHLSERFFEVKKSKTAAGVREVPISKKTLPIVTELMEKGGKYLISEKKMSYTTFTSEIWDGTNSIAGKDHRPHDTRHTCVSLLTDSGADPRVIRQIVGHASGNVTEDVYTHVSIEAKLKAIDGI